MRIKTARSMLVASALFMATVGPGIQPGAAQVVRAPVPAAVGSFGAWGAVVSQAADALRARPGLGGASIQLQETIGRLRLELAIHPRSRPALALISQLPSGMRPADFGRLALAEQVRLLEAAAGAVASALQPRADAILERAAQGGLSEADARELSAVAEQWFYLSPATAKAAKEAVAGQRASKTLGLASRVARALNGKDKKDAAVARAEAILVVNGAVRLLGEAPAGSRVEAVLAPYADRALDEAEARARERGVPAGKVYESVVVDHMKIFGSARSKELFRALRRSGEWTEFVAAATLRALERLGTMSAAARHAVTKMAETDELRLAIPAWHPLFGRYNSIAEWILETHGKPDDSRDRKGLPLGRVFGIPVYVLHSAWIAVLGYTLQFGLTIFNQTSPELGVLGNLAQGLATVAVLYASVFAHEVGHALAAKAFGIRTRFIIFNVLGGGADVVRGFRQALPEFVIALAGPVVSALCGVIPLLIAPALAATWLGPVLIAAAALNFFLAVFNMIPMFPMDGGRVLRAALTRWLGSYRATKVTAGVSWVLTAAAFAYGAWSLSHGDMNGIWSILFAAYFVYGTKVLGAHPGTTTVDETPSKLQPPVYPR